LPIVALLEQSTPSEWRRVLLAGASGAADQKAEPRVIAEVIALCLRGYVLVELSTLAHLMLGEGAPNPLSGHETQTLRILAQGASIEDASNQLGYSDRQLRRILKMIYSKLGTANRTAALIEAARRGII
jgi:two-component system response regulator DesR